MNNQILVFLFILNPFSSIFINIYALLKKNKKSILLLSLSISIFFVYLPIMYDTSSNYYYTYYLSKMNYKLNEIRLYNIVPIILKKINLDYIISILIYTIIIFYIKFKFLYNSIENRKNKKQIIYISTLFFCTIIYREVMDLNRFYLAMSLFFCAILLIKNRVYKVLLIFLAIKFHTSLILLVFLFIISNFSYDLNFLLKLSIASIFVDLRGLMNEAVDIIQKINFNLSYKLNNYIYNETWGYKVLFDLSLKKIIQKLFILILLYLIYIYLKKNIEKDKIFRLYKYCLLFNILTFNFFTLFERFSISTLFLGIILIGKSKINLSKNKILLGLIFTLNFSNFIWVNFIDYGNIFTNNYYIINNHSQKEAIIMKGISSNLFSILNVKKNGYSDRKIRLISNRGKEYIYLIRRGVKREVHD